MWKILQGSSAMLLCWYYYRRGNQGIESLNSLWRSHSWEGMWLGQEKSLPGLALWDQGQWRWELGTPSDSLQTSWSAPKEAKTPWLEAPQERGLEHLPCARPAVWTLVLWYLSMQATQRESSLTWTVQFHLPASILSAFIDTWFICSLLIHTSVAKSPAPKVKLFCFLVRLWSSLGLFICHGNRMP
jgi:hypothetical protein